MEFKLPPHFSSSEQFDASLKAVLNRSSFNTVYMPTQYQLPSWSFYLFSYTMDVRLLKCEKCQHVWCCCFTIALLGNRTTEPFKGQTSFLFACHF